MNHRLIYIQHHTFVCGILYPLEKKATKRWIHAQVNKTSEKKNNIYTLRCAHLKIYVQHDAQASNDCSGGGDGGSVTLMHTAYIHLYAHAFVIHLLCGSDSRHHHMNIVFVSRRKFLPGTSHNKQTHSYNSLCTRHTVCIEKIDATHTV